MINRLVYKILYRRTKVKSVRLTSQSGSILSAILLTSMLTACSSNSVPKATKVSDKPIVSTTTSTTVAGSSTRVGLYFIKEGRLALSSRLLPPSVKHVSLATLQSLIKGPNKVEASAGFGTEIPAGTLLEKVAVSGNTATIDLNSNFFEQANNQEIVDRVAQVVYTVTQFGSVTMVVFHLGGNQVQSFGNLKLNKPIGRTQVASALPLMLVESPAFGDSVSFSNSISFEAISNTGGTYSIQMFDRTGKQIMDVVGTLTVGELLDDSYPLSAGSVGLGRVVITVRPGSFPARSVEEFNLEIGP